MRIYIAIGCIVLLGPLSQHKVLGNLYGNDRDLYLEESDNEDYGSGEGLEGPDTDPTYTDQEGSGYGTKAAANGPYGAVYDTYDDSEDGLDDEYPEGIEGIHTGHDDDDTHIEGSGHGGTLFIDEEDEEFEGDGYQPDTGIHENIIVDERPKLESEPNTTPPPTLTDHSDMESPVQILNTSTDDRQVSIFAQPDILAAFIGGAIVGLLCAILLVMFIVYRMRKKDEGSYPLDEPKRMPLTSSYSPNDKEIYA